MKFYNTISMNDHPVKFVFSIACGWLAGLFSLAHVEFLRFGPFPNLTQHVNDAIIFGISFLKAVAVGGGSWLGATWMAYYKKKFDNWRKHRKYKKRNHE